MRTADRWALRLMAVALVGVGLLQAAAPAHAITIKKPRRNETVHSSRVNVEGTAASHAVLRVIVERKAHTLFFTSWRTVFDERIQAGDSGKWKVAVRVTESGDYRVTVRRLDSHDEHVPDATQSFRVQLDEHERDREDGDNRALRVDEPDNGARLASSRLTVRGRAEARQRVRVRLTASGNREADTETTRADSDSRWSVTLRFPAPGSYLIQAEVLGHEDKVVAHTFITVYFRPGEDAPEDVAIRITRPAEDATIHTSTPTIKGVATPGGDVRVQVLDSRSRRIHDERTRAQRNGEWDVRPTLDREGSYRIVAELLSDSGRVLARDTSDFRYERD